MKNLKVFIYLTLLLPQLGLSHQLSLKNFKDYSLGVGTWQEFYNQTQSSSSGAINGFELRPYFTASLNYYFNNLHSVIPEIGYVTRRSYTESNTTSDLFFLKIDYGYLATNWLKLRAGTSFIWRTVSGDGGEEELPNGDSTETYYAPSERKNIFNQTLDFGVQLIQKNLSLRFNTHLYAVDDSDQRMTSYSFSFNYLLPLEGL